MIAVASDKFGKGIDHLAEVPTAGSMSVVTWDQAFNQQWDTDAHFVTYLTRGIELNDPFVRCKKAARQPLIDAGAPLETSLMVFDFDLPGHEPWTDERTRIVSDHISQTPLAAHAARLYSTRHGWRMLYVLGAPLDVQSAEGFHRGVVGEFLKTPLAAYIDTGCSDWTRMFRLPRVIRDGVRTDLEMFFYEYCQEECRLDLTNIAPGEMDGRRFAAVPATDRRGCPGPDEAKALLQSVTNGRLVQTEWLKRAYARLKNRPVLDYIKGQRPLEDTGQRNNNLTAQVGSSIGILHYLEGTSPQLMFALWVDAVEQLEARTGNDDGKPWLDILWELVCRCWDGEHAQSEAKRIETEAAQVTTGKLSSVVLEGVRRWCKDPRFYGDETTALEYLLRCLIATDGHGRYYTMRADGTYDPLPCSIVALPARIRALGMDSLMPIETISTVNGVSSMHMVSPQTLVTRHATMFFEIQGHCSGVFDGSWIQDIESDSAKLCFRMFTRANLIPAYNQAVDNWLRLFFGNDYERGCNWIAQSLNFEGGPICALSLNGPPGIGKKLIVEGLGEAINTGATADARELMGRFQSQLLRTPFLIINESFPNIGRDSSKSPAAIFREATAGDSMPVERKGQGIIRCHNPLRIIITGNNDEIISSLYRNQNLSPDDRRALAVRLLHFNLNAVAAEWLRENGGINFTRGWIRGDDGHPSNFVLARHFLWLYTKRSPPAFGSRFLVEGDLNADIVKEMAVGSGDAPEILEVILSMLDQVKHVEGLVREGGVHVTAQGVRDHMRSFYQQKGISLGIERMNLRRIGGVLKGLSEYDWSPYPRSLPAGGHVPKLRWWKIDEETLQHHAENHGVRYARVSA